MPLETLQELGTFEDPVKLHTLEHFISLPAGKVDPYEEVYASRD